MSAIANILNLVEKFWGKSFTHEGRPVFEIYKGRKCIYTMVLHNPNVILSWAGKSDYVHADGLTRHATNWSKEPHPDWYELTDRKLGRHIAWEVAQLYK
jgi:hypothetical protein